jgi:excisionase family DNA binding protein
MEGLGELVTPVQAAAELGVTRARVSQLIKEGRIPALKIGGKAVGVRRVDLEAAKAVERRRTGRPRKQGG